ncbi:GntR family transcriptional regulator [Amycolatopsis mongoliensis]|uniref:GntR family transcriptional regulator n=1 Tax=Amycolatopsis mongoliensis TaxID=715475 RepID=A0A9Y2NKJ3_9PSEU|nr:GntR family transcriptional regulator [Amycolatopsis sp. 4-36]WIY05099.1 GntR family transcriptional regulator [Amycolatopsis sp. 4-36]HWD00955.1 GntR family transcriptional regulator [Amycolatopsis sp.]
MPIDQQGAQPLGAQIRDDLVRRIRAGEFALGEKIPSLKALAGTYNVAELTVHNAIRELQHAGVLESAAGRGTFVRSLPDESAPADDVAALRAEVADLRRRVEELEKRS